MTKTQIQLPDKLYQELKQLSREQEWSLAETLRRGAEILLATYPKQTLPANQWQLPLARDCGAFLTAPENWTELAHEEN